MKEFVKNNRVIFSCFCVSIFICIIYILTLDMEEWFPHAGDWFNLLFQFSVGFIINFIFYVTQIYIPSYKRNREARRCISIRINIIVGYMTGILSHLGQKYMERYDEGAVTDDYWLEILKKINENDRINVLNARRSYSVTDENAHYTVKEWIISSVISVENEIDKLLQYYAPYIDAELMVVLENILKSMMHQTMARTLLQLPEGISFKESVEDNFLCPYYKLMKKLKSVNEKYTTIC